MSKKMTYAQAKMTYELLVAECKRLRSETERHEAQFFAFLMIAERDHERLWRENGCADFEQFIRSNDLCKPYRYCLFRDGVDQAGLDAALANGAHWTMEIGKVRDIKPAELGAFKARAKAFLDVHHTSPSSEVVHDWRIELAPRRDQPARIEIFGMERPQSHGSINREDHAIGSGPGKGQGGSIENTPSAVSVSARRSATCAIPPPSRDGSA